MDEKRLFVWLEKQKKDVLLGYLRDAYTRLATEDRWEVFGKAVRSAPEVQVNGKKLLEEIRAFHADSLAGKYWNGRPQKDSRGWPITPEETKAWFDRLGTFFQACTRLSEAGDHAAAVECFAPLFELIEVDTMSEVVYADELGDWMIPGDTKQYVAAYLTSLAAVALPEAYATAVIPLIEQDYNQHDKVYASAKKAATPVQRKHLEAELRRLEVRTR